MAQKVANVVQNGSASPVTPLKMWQDMRGFIPSKISEIYQNDVSDDDGR